MREAATAGDPERAAAAEPPRTFAEQFWREDQTYQASWRWRLGSAPLLGGAAVAAAAHITRGFPLWVVVLLAVPGAAALVAPPRWTRAATYGVVVFTAGTVIDLLGDWLRGL
ncbi:MAG: hypothetical protein WCB85_11525 [Candidatus Dormiibacterota bacterium]